MNALLNPVGDLVQCNSTTNYQTDGNAYGSSANIPYLEPVEYIVTGGANGAAHENTTTSAQGNLTYRINLDAFKHTLLELNKDI